MYEVGDPITFSSKLYDKDPAVDSTAVLVNPVSAALTITDPADVVTTPTITVPPTTTGVFTYKLNAALEGRYRGRWLFTMADGSTSAYTEIFDVRASDPGFIISLNEAKQHLNIPLTKNSNDEELRSWLAAITPVVEDLVGPTIPKTYTEVVRGCNSLLLTNTPIISIVSIIPYTQFGSIYSPAQVTWDESGDVVLIYGWQFYGNVFKVTYTAGRKPIPPNIAQATKIILKHMWETQRGASGSPRLGDSDIDTTVISGYAIPNRALELLKPQLLGPSVG